MERFCPTCNKRYPGETTYCPEDGSPLFIHETYSDLVGKEIDGRFKVLKLLGQGGMGAVYLAKQYSVDRNVAIKILRKEFVGDVVVAKRFLLEAQAASKLRHPNTITIYDFGQSRDGILYIAMEYLDGKPLRDLLVQDGSLPLDRSIRIITQVADSLSEAHRVGIIHRDLKPENIFLTNMGEGGSEDYVKVLDFGIAKVFNMPGSTHLTKTGSIAGTPPYMSPEVIVGEKVDLRSDIYAMGIILYEMLAGIPPFLDETPMKVMMKHLHEEIKPVSIINPAVEIPETVHQALLKILSKDKDQRPESATAFKDLLLNALAESKSKRGSKQLAPLYTTTAGTREIGAERISQSRMKKVEVEKQPADAGKTSLFKDSVFDVMLGRKSGRRYLFAGAASIIVAGVFAAYLFLSGGGERAQEYVPETEKAAVEKVEKTSPAGGESAVKKEDAVKSIKPSEKLPPPPVQKPALFNVEIKSRPLDAEIFVNGKKEGATPIKLSLGKGEFDLVLKKEGFTDKKEKLEIEKDSVFEFGLDKKPAPKKDIRPAKTEKKERVPKKDEVKMLEDF
ncbi:MAG: serine/threonine protein kinase [Deltaproteobacteria bacterium]|nr:serine/threonine protein kinase [Deltaproteobacteria bacterium]